MRAPIPPDKAERLKAMRDYHILDTPPEKEFDDLTFLASQICGTPIALMTLIDGDRQWFKSRVGLDLTETSRDITFCAYSIMESSMLVVPDALRDTRFSENPLVKAEPRIRFYAGTPLRTEQGHALGTLCVIDREPRTLTPEQTEAPCALSRQASSQLALRKTVAALKEAMLQLDRAYEVHERLAAIVEFSNDAIIGEALDGTITSWNTGAECIFGYCAEEAIGRNVAMLLPPDRPDETPRTLERIGRGERMVHFETERVTRDGRHLTCR